MAVGARFEIFSGAQKQSSEVSSASGYLGPRPGHEILAGLGTEELADVVRILWPGGRLLQDELQVPGGQARRQFKKKPSTTPPVHEMRSRTDERKTAAQISYELLTE